MFPAFTVKWFGNQSKQKKSLVFYDVNRLIEYIESDLRLGDNEDATFKVCKKPLDLLTFVHFGMILDVE